MLPDRWKGGAATIVELADAEEATIIWVGSRNGSSKRESTYRRCRPVCGGAAIPRGLMGRMDNLALRMLHTEDLGREVRQEGLARLRAQAAPLAVGV
jgi:hypothetical protein